MDKVEEIKKRVKRIEMINDTPPETTLNVPMSVEEVQFILTKLEMAEREVNALKYKNKQMESILGVAIQENKTGKKVQVQDE